MTSSRAKLTIIFPIGLSFSDGEEQNEILHDSLGGACWLESRVIKEN